MHAVSTEPDLEKGGNQAFRHTKEHSAGGYSVSSVRNPYFVRNTGYSMSKSSWRSPLQALIPCNYSDANRLQNNLYPGFERFGSWVVTNKEI